MQAAILYGAHDFRLEERPAPEIQDDECLIKVRACGVCHSEIPQWEARLPGLEYPRFIGHEVAGEVMKTGVNVKDFKAGDRVAVWIDGKGYAEQVAVHNERIYPIAPDIPFECALAEPIGCVINGVLKTNVQLADTVALVGCGFMGLIVLQVLRWCGAKELIAVDVRDEQLAMADKMGATKTIHPQKQDAAACVREWTGGRGVDVAFEIGGSQATLDLAADICRMEGKLVIFGYHPGSRTIKDLGYWNWMAFELINAHFRDVKAILRGSRIGMDVLNMKKIDMAPLITHRFPLQDIEKAFCAAKDKPQNFIKSVLVLP